MNLGWMAKNWGQMAMGAGRGIFGRTIQGATLGAAVGAGWGAMSSDTSVLSGALMGAGLGAAGMRYGGAALGASSFRGGAMRAAARMRGDVRGLWSNTTRVASKMRRQAARAPAGATMSCNQAPIKVPPGIRNMRAGWDFDDMLGPTLARRRAKNVFGV